LLFLLKISKPFLYYEKIDFEMFFNSVLHDSLLEDRLECEETRKFLLFDEVYATIVAKP